MRKNFYTLLVALTLICTSAFAQINVLYVHENSYDQEVMDAITAKGGYTVTPLLKEEATPLSADDLSTLNAAQVVIIGRSINSARCPHDVMDQVTAPMIYTSPFIVRGDRAGMVTATSASNEISDGAVVQAVISDASNPVFNGVSAGTIDWWTGYYSILGAEIGTTNATLMVKTADERVLLSMYDANVPFQTGGRTPAGPRAYIGNGQDNTGETYFSFTDNAKIIFFNLINEMAAKATSVSTSKVVEEVLAIGGNGKIVVNGEQTIEVISMDGKVVKASKVNGSMPCDAGIYIVKVADSTFKVIVK
ncbi:MAG: T9SS type A sorting domain-containing protein [Marinilabiliaceae bacterium]|nr:T9SS type A sorting domain-containing protein [Marinilabiliaceae bacterium]